jgi:hypothetical protein
VGRGLVIRLTSEPGLPVLDTRPRGQGRSQATAATVLPNRQALVVNLTALQGGPTLPGQGALMLTAANRAHAASCCASRPQLPDPPRLRRPSSTPAGSSGASLCQCVLVWTGSALVHTYLMTPDEALAVIEAGDGKLIYTKRCDKHRSRVFDKWSLHGVRVSRLTRINLSPAVADELGLPEEIPARAFMSVKPPPGEHIGCRRGCYLGLTT